MDKLLTDFVPYLRCPITGTSLKVLSSANLQDLNSSIKEKQVKHQDGSLVEEELSEALISEDKQFVYPVIDGNIAALLDYLAIPTSWESQKALKNNFSDEKKKVQSFYDEFGWKKGEDDLFKDTITFEDRRSVAEKYWSRCHLRLNKYLGKGKYILDVASGAIPNKEYFTYSDNYEVRICMDFSLLALKEAARRVQNGIFILGDMTNIPIAEECIDAVISLHTVYHVPKNEQTKAVAEVYRVLKGGTQAVIVYSWKNPHLMKLSMGFWRTFYGLYKNLRRRKKVKMQNGQTEARPELFVNQQDYDWFFGQIKKPYHAKLKVYSAISRSFSNTFIREKAFGKQFSSLIYKMEDLFPSLLGKYGQYPVFILQKPAFVERKNEKKETVLETNKAVMH